MSVQINNKIQVVGNLLELPHYDYMICGEGFLTGKINVKRLSEQDDILPFIISERLLQDSQLELDAYSVTGSLRSHNSFDGKKSRLNLNIFIDNLERTDEGAGTNNAMIDGYICKAPVYRLTPLDREITDILIAVNRAYGKSDYIPCIAWGRNARYCSHMEVGTRLKVQGRFQSRGYQKKTEEGIVTKTAYELSISKIFEE